MTSVDLLNQIERMIERQQSSLYDMEADPKNRYAPGIPYTTGYLHALEHIRDLLLGEVTLDETTET